MAAGIPLAAIILIAAILIGSPPTAAASMLPPAPTVTASLASGATTEASTFTTFDVVIENTAGEPITFTATSNYLNFTVAGAPTSTCPGFPDASLAAGASCSISWPVQAGLVQGPGEPADAFVRIQPWFDQGLGGGSDATTVIVARTSPLPPPPTVSSSFAAGASMYERQTTTFDVIIDNTASPVPASTGVSISVQNFDNAPGPDQLTTTCFFGGGSFSVSAGETCTISRKVIARRAGAGDGYAQARLSRYSLLTSSSIEILPQPVPVLGIEIMPATVEAFTVNPVTVTFDHSAGLIDATDLDTVVRVSGSLMILATGVASTCTGPAPTVGNGQIRVQGISIPAGASCALTFLAVAQTPNVYEFTVDGSSSLDDPDPRLQNVDLNFVRKDLVVLPSSLPITPLQVAFEYSDLLTPLTRLLTFQFDNSANAVPAVGIQANLAIDNLVVIDPGTIQTTCGGTVTLLPPEMMIADAGVGAGESCEVSMIASSPTPGLFQFLGSAWASSIGESDSVRTSFSLGDSVLEIETAFVPAQLDPGESGELVVSIRRPLTGPTATIDATTTVPAGVVAEGTYSTSCGGEAAISEFQFIQFFGGSLAPGHTCKLIFPISSQVEGSYSTFATVGTEVGPVDSRAAMLMVGSACASPDIVAEPGVPVFGTAASEVILGTEGPDRINGGGGNDIICGLGGDDRLVGGAGNDIIFGDGGRDLITGGNGRDQLNGGAQVDRIYGQAGNDMILGDGGSDRIRAGEGDDTVLAGSGADRVWGGPGDDELRGMGGQDRMWGEDGDDSLQGNWQSDRLWGGPGNDRIAGAQGKDKIYGEDGDDALFGGNNTDYLDGGPGTDTADGQKGKDNPLVPDISGCIAETQASC